MMRETTRPCCCPNPSRGRSIRGRHRICTSARFLSTRPPRPISRNPETAAVERWETTLPSLGPTALSRGTSGPSRSTPRLSELTPPRSLGFPFPTSALPAHPTRLPRPPLSLPRCNERVCDHCARLVDVVSDSIRRLERTRISWSSICQARNFPRAPTQRSRSRHKLIAVTRWRLLGTLVVSRRNLIFAARTPTLIGMRTASVELLSITLAFALGCASSNDGPGGSDRGGSSAMGGSAPSLGGSVGQSGAGTVNGGTGSGGLPSGGSPAGGASSNSGGVGGRANGGAGGKANGGAGGRASGGSGSGGAGACVQNLACKLSAPPATGDIHQDCVDRINQFLTQCACLPALT